MKTIYPKPYTYIAVTDSRYYWIHSINETGVSGTPIDDEFQNISLTPNITLELIQEIGIEGDKDITDDETLEEMNTLMREALKN